MKYSEDLYIRLVEKYGNMVYRIGFVRLNNLCDAEDICQEVFEKLFIYLSKADYFKSEDHIKGWLATAASNAGISRLRSAYRRKRGNLPDEIPFTDEEYEKRELLDCISRLDALYSEVIYLYYYEGFSIDEIAGIQNVSSSTVKTRLKRGRAALKGMLEKP